jgi:hypothetical protein
MRDDLLDAQAAIKWAEAQVPLFQNAFLEWQRRGPYEIVAERDPDSSDQLIVAYQRTLLDPLIVVESGVIVNAIRTSLDMLAAALSRRNGIEPDRHTKFPIHELESGLRGELNTIKHKQWLSDAEITAIESCKPYKGGDETLYPLHRLDILRKHERLIGAEPTTAEFRFSGYGLRGGKMDWRRLKDKTILHRFPANTLLNPSQGNTNLVSEITFNEPALGLVNEPAIPLLRKFAKRCAEIVSKFDI